MVNKPPPFLDYSLYYKNDKLTHSEKQKQMSWRVPVDHTNLRLIEDWSNRIWGIYDTPSVTGNHEKKPISCFKYQVFQFLVCEERWLVCSICVCIPSACQKSKKKKKIFGYIQEHKSAVHTKL